MKRLVLLSTYLLRAFISFGQFLPGDPDKLSLKRFKVPKKILYPPFLALAILLLANFDTIIHPADSTSADVSEFVNYETAHVHPLDMTPSKDKLLAVNIANNSLEVFDILPNGLNHSASIAVGIDPVSVRALNDSIAWVVNQVSDNVSIVNLNKNVVENTIEVGNEPGDVVFAGTPLKAFVSCGEPSKIYVFNVANLSAAPVIKDVIGEDLRAMAVSPDGSKVYAAFFESSNQTTALEGDLGPGITALVPNLQIEAPIVPPNNGSVFNPPLGPAGFPTLLTRPSLPVRKNNATGQWLDDNGTDWSHIISGGEGNRVFGWDMLDRDVVVMNANDNSFSYQNHLGNILMAMDVNPVTGKIFVVGTDATNEIRFEPVLNGKFLRVNVASFNEGQATEIDDLNPHLNYQTSSVAVSERVKSIGDPRGIAWKSDGSKAYITGMGSNNLITIDGNGNRLSTNPINVGEGPTGIKLNESLNHAYVLNKFDGSISIVDLNTETEIETVAFFDPTPEVIKLGRKHLYNTHLGSGTGHISCASCHVDARNDRLAWDLGNPAGEMENMSPSTTILDFGAEHNPPTFHPMKGLMVTQSFQDVIKQNQLLHWRGDRDNLAEFAGAFVHLQGADAEPSASDMQEFEDFLAEIYWPPNPNRNLDNSFNTNMELPRPEGAAPRFADAEIGRFTFTTNGGPVNTVGQNTCIRCHSPNTGRGTGVTLSQAPQARVPQGFRGNLDMAGYWKNYPTASTSGFGFFSNGAMDSEHIFIDDPNFGDNFAAFVYSAEGSDWGADPSFTIQDSQDSHAAVGQQVTLNNSNLSGSISYFNTLKSIVDNDARISLIASGAFNNEIRNFYYLGNDNFQSDRSSEQYTTSQLTQSNLNSNTLTFTVVHDQIKIGASVDKNYNGILDKEENLLANFNFIYDFTSDLPIEVAFDASSTFDPNGFDDLVFYWDFNNGNTGFGIQDSTLYNVENTYQVELTVIDTLLNDTSIVVKQIDIYDICPNLANTLIGTSCDDGLDCTTSDTWGTDCICSGIPTSDQDNDGICDALDNCPSFDNNLIGTACDDGDECTIGEIYDQNCNCTSGQFFDTDNDGICDIFDLDDDNDGILDDVEDFCPSASISFSDLTFTNPNLINAVADGFNGVVNSGFQSTYSNELIEAPIHLEFEIVSGDEIIVGFLPQGGLQTPNDYNDGAYKFWYSYGSMYHTFNTSSSFDNITYNLTDKLEIDIDASGVITGKVNNVVIGTVATGATMFNLAITAGSAFTVNELLLTQPNLAAIACDIDIDNDGILNSKDTDSDNDGCIDAIEGDGNFSYVNITNNQLNGAVDGSGIPTIANGGQNVGSSLDNAVQAQNCCDQNSLDSDNDGVCDAIDECPGFNNSLIGSPCNDNVTCTINDVWQSDCSCAGVPDMDSDNDGICDSEDNCPNFNNGLIGTACDDGNPCTQGELYDANCNCTGGSFTDTDGDGICDEQDPCPYSVDNNGAGGLLSIANNAGTLASYQTSSASLSNAILLNNNSQVSNELAIMAHIADNKYIAIVNDYDQQAASYELELNADGTFTSTLLQNNCGINTHVYPLLGLARNASNYIIIYDYLGTVGYDELTLNTDGSVSTNYITVTSGLPITTLGLSYKSGNEFYHLDDDGVGTAKLSIVALDTTSNTFNTVSVISNDSGISRNTVDFTYLDGACPDCATLVGMPCDDGLSCTSNDVFANNCECAGTPTSDSDNDGVCDSQDLCAGLDDNLIGTACNDGDACTTNDMYTSNCLCEGTIMDSDNDGICDNDDICPFSPNNIDNNNDGICDATSIVINEIITNNNGSETNLLDEDGDSPDYIELYNTTAQSINIGNWKLIDSDDIYKFPAGLTLNANSYLTVWASGKDRKNGILHTNFKLSSSGEYLGLYDDNNNLIFDFGTTYPQQFDGYSYGLDNNQSISYFTAITKDSANSNASNGKVSKPYAVKGRGFYQNTVIDTLLCDFPNAQIRYTTDGSEPNSSSTLFTNNIIINPSSTGIVVIKAKAFATGVDASDEVTWSYVFANTLFPNNSNASQGVESLPVVSINTDNLQDIECINPTISNQVWDCNLVNTSFEWIAFDSLANQVNVQSTSVVEQFGQGSISYSQEKINYRFKFDEIEFPFFEGYNYGEYEATTKFKRLEIRGSTLDSYENDGPIFNNSGNYITENWFRSTNLELGNYGIHSRFVNVFLNGEFKGVYTARERFDHHYYDAYLDESSDDVSSIKIDGVFGFENVSNGNINLWNQIQSDLNYQNVKSIINTESFITRKLLESLWEEHGEREYRVISPLITDDNNEMLILNADVDLTFSDNSLMDWNPSIYLANDNYLPMWYSYINDPEFVQDVLEITAKAFCNNGALTTTESQNRLDDWVAEVELAMHAELDRTTRVSNSYNYATWQARIALVQSKLNQLAQMPASWSTSGLYDGCDLRPIVDTENQISEINSTVSYFIDATDPDGDAMTFTAISGLPPGLSINATTGEISGTPTQLGTFDVKIKVEDTNNKWGYHYFIWEVINLPTVPAGIVINEIMYHPDSLCLGLPADADMLGYIELKNTGNQTINLSRSTFSDGLDFEFPTGASIAPGGFYVIAEDACAFELAYGFAPNAEYKGSLSNDGERIELSDAYKNIIDSLTFNDVNPWDEDPDGKGPSLELLNTNFDNNAPLSWFRSDDPCGTPGAENSRICTNTAEQIIINEINYNSNNGVTDPGDWVELHNPTANAIDISDWTFYDNNNEFIFPSGTIIQPDDYLVLVENDTMFTTIFPHLTSNDYLGNFSFGLSNKGERVSLFDENKCLSDYVIYNDRIPWDTIPDGNGPTLSLITPNSDNALAQSWEASSNINSAYGTPGRVNAPCLVQQIVIPDTIYSGIDTLLTVDILDDNVAYTWNVVGATLGNGNADSTSVNFANPGTYNIQLITNYFECTKVAFKQVVVVPGCVDIQLHAYLEGAYDTATGEMRNTLVSARKLLPGQTPVSPLATPTPAGQPYSIVPWNYSGTEGAGWTNADYTGDETDWILVSFRTGTAKSTEIGMTAALLNKDGSIDFPDRCALDASVADSLYILIEHRNHIGIMSPAKVPIINNELFYDFRAMDSYRDVTSFGQKQISTGEWVMFAGDASQMDFPSFDINGTDKTIWFNNNGVFDYYLSPDFNLDGDVNGQDKSIWFDNNGISSRVPK